MASSSLSLAPSSRVESKSPQSLLLPLALIFYLLALCSFCWGFNSWQVQAGLELDERTKHLLQASARELLAERHAAFTLCGLELPLPETGGDALGTQDNSQTTIMDASPDVP